jgi:hypothetical protein
LGALQNEHGGTELDGGRRLGIVEDGEQGFQSAVAEMVEVVTAGEDEFGAGAVEGGDEGLGGFHPTVDGNAMDAVGFGGVGEGGAGGQGVDDALLDTGEGRVVGGVSHFDDENSMGGRGGLGMAGGIVLWFHGDAGVSRLVIDRGREGRLPIGLQVGNPQRGIAATKEAA